MVSESEVIEKLKIVVDPHTGMSVYDMGLISDLKIEGDKISLKFTPTSPFCPIGANLAMGIKNVLKEIEGVKEVEVIVKGHVQEKELNEMLKSC